MSFSEIKITAIKWPQQPTDEEQEIHTFIDHLDEQKIKIPDRLYKMMMQDIDTLSFQRKPEVLQKFLGPIPGLKVSKHTTTIRLPELPYGTEAIRIECIHEKPVEIEKTTPITKAEAITKYGASAVFEYPHGDWGWEDQDEWTHLMRLVDGKWVDLTKGIKAIDIYSYPNGDWAWQDQDGWWNLI